MAINRNRWSRYEANLKIAFEAVLVNKMRTMLTALGIIFGVAAVISMLAIGNGAKKEVLDQMKLIGVNNIVVRAKKVEKKFGEQNKNESEQDKDKKSKEKLSAGLSIEEANSIRKILPSVEYVSVETEIETSILYSGKDAQGKLVGVNKDFFHVYQLSIETGRTPGDYNYKNASQVCVIGYKIKSRLFPTVSAIGKEIKCADSWYKVIGVMSLRGQSNDMGGDMGMRDFDKSVFIPIQSFLKRHNDKSVVTKRILQGWDEEELDPNRNQIETMVVQVKDSKKLRASADLINRILKRKHSGAEDFSITVPELLLKQEQKTRSIFNIVLGAIASISLIVGGIGIMNIMLASVVERTKEIGIRRSIGATAKDIVFQFIAEAAIISLIGGFIGVILGIFLAFLVSKLTDIPVIISWFSVMISFFISASVGIVFGFTPAQKAAKEDIIIALRHE
jgi:putative ABC transport system permease protein